MISFEDKLKNFVVELFKINAIKFGDYKTKIGLTTPVYCDLRVLVSFPTLMETLACLLVEYVPNIQSFDTLCGVPYTALPIATAVSIKTNIPMVMRRKEAKDYGTKNIIEGVYKEGDRCLIVEDVITSGSSILETAKDLKEAGISISDAVILLNREQGGEYILKRQGILVQSLLSMTKLMGILKEANCIDDSIVEKVSAYLKACQVDSNIVTTNSQKNRLKCSYKDRIQAASNPVAKDLLNIMSSKQTNLCVAADLTNAVDVLNLAEEVGPYICLLKMHIDIIEDFHPNLLNHLKEIAERHNFILLEDRKFADIGKTVELQYSTGIYHISSWANLVTVHSVTGKSVLDAIKQCKGLEKRGVFLLAEMSASDNLIDENYTKATVKLATKNVDLVTGIVCQSPLFLDNVGLIQLTPGVQLGASSDNLGQQYDSPENVIINKGADIAVVGRGITKASDRGSTAEKYKMLLWDAYLRRIQ